ncbi:hypothetical protein FAZ95_23315 [Trinickia violacea]|uniref:Amidohydrolase n=1 Tax=Trinickia violacea TaxID=2571746 RepID=A0A4P8IX98_9BURK|nr:hypothetical protein FAZ95_23315 [Trinickia violacea]
MPRIDARQHYWRISERAGYWPPRELSPIYRDFGPSDLTGAVAALPDVFGGNACRFYRVGAMTRLA